MELDIGCIVSQLRHRNGSDEIIHMTLNNSVLLCEFDSASRRPRIGIHLVMAQPSQ